MTHVTYTASITAKLLQLLLFSAHSCFKKKVSIACLWHALLRRAVTAGPSRPRRKGISKEDREMACLLHRTHLLCLLSRGLLYDQAASHALLQVGIIPMSLPSVSLPSSRPHHSRSMCHVSPVDVLTRCCLQDKPTNVTPAKPGNPGAFTMHASCRVQHAHLLCFFNYAHWLAWLSALLMCLADGSYVASLPRFHLAGYGC